MNNDKLIELVKEYKFLYDLSHRKYSDNQMKEEAWHKIAIKLGRGEKECKKAWALLRDAFRRAVRKKKENVKSGQVSGLERMWKYEEEMAFLLPYMKEKPASNSVSERAEGLAGRDITDDEVVEEVTPVYCPPEDMSRVQSNIDVKVETEPQMETEPPQQILVSPDLSSMYSPSASLSPPRPKRQNRTMIKEESPVEETPSTPLIMQYLMENKSKPPDNIEQFFTGIAATVRSFPPRDRAIAKAKVFEIVSKMEIEILSRPSTSPKFY